MTKSSTTEDTARNGEHGKYEQNEPRLPFLSVTSVVVL